MKGQQKIAPSRAEAWTLHKGEGRQRGELTCEYVDVPSPAEDEVLAEPLYGCWEANMTHAVLREPVDVCRLRGEDRVVLGNAGVVRVLEPGFNVTDVRAGDICIVAPIGSVDRQGYLLDVMGYDARGSSGLLAKRVVLTRRQIEPVPQPSRFSLRQWASFSVRYGTAWDNWSVAYGCWRQQMCPDETVMAHVWAWGGGVALAELQLASLMKCQTAMISSRPERLELIRSYNIKAIDRRQFVDLDFDPHRYDTDGPYRKRYIRAMRVFLDIVYEETGGEGVSIFIDNIGAPVYPATLRALGRQGVLTTVGWKRGMDLTYHRARECVQRHIYVHTHGGRSLKAAVAFAEQTGWIAPEPEECCAWDDIPQLARDYEEEKILSYFPIFQINAP